MSDLIRVHKICGRVSDLSMVIRIGASNLLRVDKSWGGFIDLIEFTKIAMRSVT